MKNNVCRFDCSTCSIYTSNKNCVPIDLMDRLADLMQEFNAQIDFGAEKISISLISDTRDQIETIDFRKTTHGKSLKASTFHQLSI